MTSSADELVSEFCVLWATPDVEKLAAYFTEDAVYHNIPMQPLHGRTAIREFIEGSPWHSMASTSEFIGSSAMAH